MMEVTNRNITITDVRPRFQLMTEFLSIQFQQFLLIMEQYLVILIQYKTKMIFVKSSIYLDYKLIIHLKILSCKETINSVFDIFTGISSRLFIFFRTTYQFYPIHHLLMRLFSLRFSWIRRVFYKDPRESYRKGRKCTKKR